MKIFCTALLLWRSDRSVNYIAYLREGITNNSYYLTAIKERTFNENAPKLLGCTVLKAFESIVLHLKLLPLAVIPEKANIKLKLSFSSKGRSKFDSLECLPRSV
jgi:hypothetical protein